MQRPQVAVLGGGLTGVTTALELADRGCQVDLYEQAPALLLGVSGLCEGKIHLGFVYANDPTGLTLPLMLRGALVFRPLLERWLGGRAAWDQWLSAPFYYAVPRDSALAPEAIAAHFAQVKHLGAAMGWQTRYVAPVQEGYRRLSLSEQQALFDPETIVAAYLTEERAVDPAALAQQLRRCASAQPRLRLRLRTRVEAVTEARGRLRVQVAGASEAYDHVVNALWADRLRVDATCLPQAARSAYYRHKTGFFVTLADFEHSQADYVALTLVHGAFGDSVRWGQRYYFSWYPAGMRRRYYGITPPPLVPLQPEQAGELITRTLTGLAHYCPALRRLHLTPAQCQLAGGEIVAWGRSDIDDPASELHQRHAVGVQSYGNYHSIDTGKYTLAPLWGLTVAERIWPTGMRV